MKYVGSEDEVEGNLVRHFTKNEVNKISLIFIITLTSHVIML